MITYLDSRRIQGLSTDTVPATLTYPFGSAITSESSSYIYVTGGELYHLVQRGTARVAYQDTSINPSTTNWTMTVKMRVPARSVGGNNNAYFGFSSSTVNQDSDAGGYSGNFVGFYINLRTSGEAGAHGVIGLLLGNTYAYNLAQSDNSLLLSDGIVEHTKWIKIVKNGNVFSLTIHDSASDATNGVLSSGSNTVSITNATAGAFTNLRYMKWFNVASGSTNTANVYYDDLTLNYDVVGKPTNVETNSIFIETDTAKRIWYNGSNWQIPSSITDAIIFGGNSILSGFANISASEEYNGTSWTSGGSLSTPRETAGSCGSGSTSARFVQGYTQSPTPYPNSNLNEGYNGTSWSIDTAHPSSTNNKQTCMTGSKNDCIIGSGHRNGTGDVDETHAWNGTSWTSKTVLAGYGSAWSGTPINALITIGGSAYTFNGTSFTSITATNESRMSAHKSGGSSTSGMRAGNSTVSVTTEKYNGTSWVSKGSRPVATQLPASCGQTDDSMITAGGFINNYASKTTGVYEFNYEVWSTKASISTVKSSMGGAGQ